jgi:hyperosmotically inducible periplasmic protein
MTSRYRHCVRVAAALFALGCLSSRGFAADHVASPSGAQYPADNTGKNVRDRGESAVTADQQSNSQGDMNITREIRRQIVNDKSLSTSAHNVKVVTVDGVVTLRGPVVSSKEKTVVAETAKKVAGVNKVDNQLEIAKP